MRSLLPTRPATAALLLIAAAALAPSSPFAHGGTVKYLGLDIASQPQEDIFARWEAETGHTLQKTYFDIPALVENVERDIKIDNVFDVYQTWVPVYNLASQGYLMDLTNDVKDAQFEWTSIPPAARDWLTTYQDRVYGIPVDADPLVLYYRRDLISEPPVSWEGLIETAKQFHGQDLNGDGTADYGTCIITEGQAAIYPFLIANSVMNAQGSRREHFLFDANDDDTIPMASNMRTAGWEYTMDILRQLYQVSQGWGLASGFGPENAYAVFKTGRCATMISFPSAGSWTAEAPNGTFMRTRLGVTRTPGSSKIYDRATNTMKTCTPDICKFMEYGNVNRPGFVAGAVNLIINADSPNREAAVSFAAYFSVHADVRRPGALNPYRNSHWNATWYTELEPVAWDKEDARQYTSTLYDTMTGNAVSYPRLPGNDVLAARVEAAFKECVRFESSPYNTSTRTYSEILAEMETKIFEDLLAAGYTRKQTEQNWRIDVGLPPLQDPPAAASFPVVGIVFIVFVVILILVGLAIFIKVVVLKNANAPKTGSMAIIFAGPRQATELWDNHPERMEEMTQQFAKAIQASSSSAGCYPVKRVGDAHMIAAKTPEAALQLVVNLSKTLYRASWTVIDDDNDAKNEDNESTTMRTSTQYERASNRSQRSGTSSRRSVRSDRVSVYSRGSRVSRATGENVPTEFEISIGVQYGHCTAHFDTLTERFDYHGTIVDDAARCADAAASGQVLITEDVFDAMSSTVADDFTLKQFCEKKLNSGEKVLHQVDVRGIPRRKFKNNKSQGGNGTDDGANDGATGDSILSALELESTGITSRRITVLHCRFRGLTSASSKISKDTFASNYTKFVEELHSEVSGARGHIHSLLGDDVVITFGANTNCSSQVRRAVQTCFALEELAADMKVSIEFKSSVVSGLAQVGLVSGVKESDDLPASRKTPTSKAVKYSAVISPILTVGQALLGVSCQYAGISCVTTSAARDDLNTFAYSQAIDIVDLPTLQGFAGGVPHRPQIILGVMCERSSNLDDEWMYELQTQEEAHPFALVNRGFDALLNGDVKTAQESLERYRTTKEKVQKQNKDGSAKTNQTQSPPAEETLKNHVGLNNLESALRTIEEKQVDTIESKEERKNHPVFVSSQTGFFSSNFFE